ncbi:DMT family transporter [Actinomyces vulturis]|uniref:DMT family transporter n=1 Tax=Actinomyces vulturis TaxID=1857645 RepID=UPI00082DE9FF|nr:DMT family transporter [Actinomyces vulturis]
MNLRPPAIFARRNTAFLPGMALIAVSIIFGSSFWLTKDVLDRVPMWDFLGVRFTVAALFGSIVTFPRLRVADRSTWKIGGTLGLFYSAGQIFQTYGLTQASASVSGFITALYVVGTPIVAFFLFNARVSKITMVALILALTGTAVLGLDGLSVGFGELTLVIGAIFYSLHVACTAQWAGGRDPLAIAVIQAIVMAAIHLVIAAPGGIQIPHGAGDWGITFYLAIVVGLGALVLQTWAQARMNAARAAVILSAEPVFAAAFAILIGGEALTSRLLIGGAFILVGTLLAEIGPPRPVRNLHARAQARSRARKEAREAKKAQRLEGRVLSAGVSTAQAQRLKRIPRPKRPRRRKNAHQD